MCYIVKKLCVKSKDSRDLRKITKYLRFYLVLHNFTILNVPFLLLSSLGYSCYFLKVILVSLLRSFLLLSLGNSYSLLWYSSWFPFFISSYIFISCPINLFPPIFPNKIFSINHSGVFSKVSDFLNYLAG